MENAVLGMLYLADIRYEERGSEEIVRQRLLVVGNESADVERKLRWAYDITSFKSFSVVAIEKVREKVHVLHTHKQLACAPANGVIQREEGSQAIPSLHRNLEEYDPKLYAVGIVTTMLAKDPQHALRKVGSAISNSGSAKLAKVHGGPSLSENSQVTVEEIPKSSGYAAPRDVSKESNRAHFVRG